MQKRDFIIIVTLILATAMFANNLNSGTTGKLTIIQGEASSSSQLTMGEDKPFPPKNIVCEDIECLDICIQQVETGGEPNGGCGAAGDCDKNGQNCQSFGKYQIQAGTIDYAKRYFSSLNKDPPEGADDQSSEELLGPNSQLTCEEQSALSEKIKHGNWGQAATANSGRRAHQFTCEDLARIHNGGPSGHKRESTVDYWNKVKECMCEMCPSEVTTC